MAAFANFKSAAPLPSQDAESVAEPMPNAAPLVDEHEEKAKARPPASVPAEDEESPPGMQSAEHEYVRANCIFSGKLKTFAELSGVPLLEQFASEYNPDPAGAERAVSGLLLFGPSGTGKTAGAQAIAHELNARLYKMSMADMQTRASMARIDALFDVVQDGPQPAVIFLDEVDTLLSKSAYARCGHFATRFERFQKNVLVIGATNEPTKISPKILFGRFERKILVDNPSLAARRALISKQLAQESTPANMSADDIMYVAKQLEGRSAVNIERVVSTAVKRALGGVDMMDFDLAIEQEPSDFDDATAKKNKQFNEQHGWRGAW